ncbi:Uncharacterised protein [Mycobacteroides abscessus subsp. massiliense]|nr:Uncharacterised protein [Mycobacteroides abscessus subsp. massiliense]
MLTQCGGDPQYTANQIVARKNGDFVVPHSIRGMHTAAHQRTVHHVIVIERCQMSDLDHRRREHHLRIVGTGPELRRQ